MGGKDGEKTGAAAISVKDMPAGEPPELTVVIVACAGDLGVAVSAAASAAFALAVATARNLALVRICSTTTCPRKKKRKQ